MLFGYSLDEIQKMVISLITLGGGAAAILFVGDYDPGLTDALVLLVPAAVGVYSVFATPQFSIDDLSKAVAHLQAATFGVVGFFITLDPSVEVQVTTLVGLVISTYAVFRKANAGARSRFVR